MKSVVFASLAILLAGCATVSEEQGSASAAAAPSAPAAQAPEALKPTTVAQADSTASFDESTKKICKVMKSTSSRISRVKVCKTKEEWASAEANARRGVGDSQNKGAYNLPNQ